MTFRYILNPSQAQALLSRNEKQRVWTIAEGAQLFRPFTITSTEV